MYEKNVVKNIVCEYCYFTYQMLDGIIFRNLYGYRFELLITIILYYLN